MLTETENENESGNDDDPTPDTEEPAHQAGNDTDEEDGQELRHLGSVGAAVADRIGVPRPVGSLR